MVRKSLMANRLTSMQIDDIGYILRGYEDFDGKLRSLGAEIRKVHSEKEIEKFEYSVG